MTYIAWSRSILKLGRGQTDFLEARTRRILGQTQSPQEEDMSRTWPEKCALDLKFKDRLWYYSVDQDFQNDDLIIFRGPSTKTKNKFQSHPVRCEIAVARKPTYLPCHLSEHSPAVRHC